MQIPYLIRFCVSLNIRNAVSSRGERSSAVPYSRKYSTASRYFIACVRWSFVASAACFRCWASFSRLIGWSL